MSANDEASLDSRRRALKAKIDQAWDDPRPGLPADEVFERIEALHAEAIRRSGGG